MYPGIKITFDDVEIMRALWLYNRKVYTSGKLSQLFGLSRSHASKVIRGDSYKYICFPIHPYAGEISKEFINNQLGSNSD